MGLSWAEINTIWVFTLVRAEFFLFCLWLLHFLPSLLEIISACPSVGSAQTPGGGGHSVYGLYLGGGICVGV